MDKLMGILPITIALCDDVNRRERSKWSKKNSASTSATI
jgi:hypothetical protein